MMGGLRVEPHERLPCRVLFAMSEYPAWRFWVQFSRRVQDHRQRKLADSRGLPGQFRVVLGGQTNGHSSNVP